METHPKDDVRRAPTLANHNGIVKSVPQKRNTFIYNKTWILRQFSHNNPTIMNLPSAKLYGSIAFELSTLADS